MSQVHEVTRRRRWSHVPLLAALIALVLIAAACGSDKKSSDDNGGKSSDTTAASGGNEGGGAFEINTDDCETDPETIVPEGDTIKFGTSLTKSGPYATFEEILKGANAYISYLNQEKGGVDIGGKKYKIELVDKDDAYDASKTVTNVQSLIDSDEVFGLFNVVGTKNNASIRDILNDGCIPGLFAATGSPMWGNTDYPWVEGTMLVPYPLEMQALVNYLKENKPSATIAVLYADDDFGRSYSETLDKLIEGTELKVVKKEPYNPENPETKPQVTSLAATKADVFVIGATLTACPNALNNMGAAGWKPMVYMSGTCTSKTLMALAGANGDKVISVGPLLDPADPANNSNPAMKLYQEKVKQYAPPKTDVTNGIVAYGWSVAALLEYTLNQVKEEPNRLNVMETARTITDVKGVGLQLPDAQWTVNEDDWFLGEEFFLVQYSAANKFFSPIGDLQKFDGQTAEITPENLINAK
jgi:branched-chain amino acid transport system substrate-binding protein